MIYRIYNERGLIDCAFHLINAQRKFDSYLADMRRGYCKYVYMTEAENDQAREKEIRRG